MRKIRVLHIHTLPVVSGSGINTLLTMIGLDKNRYEVDLACAGQGRLEDEAVAQGFNFRPIKHLVRRVSLYNDIGALCELTKLMRGQRYDIVHTHNSKAGILGRIAAKCSGVPIIIHTMHSCVFRYPNLNIIQRKFYYYLEKFAALLTDKIIAISRPLQEIFIKTRLAPVEKIAVIYSGIDIENFRRRFNAQGLKEKFDIKPDELIVGMVARLAAGKGYKVFLRAAAKVVKEIPNVKFVLVGDGPLRHKLEVLSKKLGIRQKCIFAGFYKDVEEITSIFDVAVLASFYEGMSRVLLEAQALGKPVVASRVGGIPDIVNDGVTGILVPVGNERALAQAIIRLLKDEALRKQMGQAALRWVDTRFSKQTMVEGIVRVYEQFIDAKLMHRVDL